VVIVVTCNCIGMHSFLSDHKLHKCLVVLSFSWKEYPYVFVMDERLDLYELTLTRGRSIKVERAWGRGLYSNLTDKKSRHFSFEGNKN